VAFLDPGEARRLGAEARARGRAIGVIAVNAMNDLAFWEPDGAALAQASLQVGLRALEAGVAAEARAVVFPAFRRNAVTSARQAELAAIFLAAMAEAAGPDGPAIGYECAIAPALARRVVATAGAPRVHLVFDPLNLARAGQDWLAAWRGGAELFGDTAHVKDGMVAGSGTVPLGSGEIDVRRVLARVLRRDPMPAILLETDMKRFSDAEIVAESARLHELIDRTIPGVPLP